MADVRPLPGLRFAAEADIAQLVTPPYDVISPEAQARYYERHPHNIVRLELGRDEPGDDALDNRYTRAAILFAEWRLDGVLRQDAPSLYLYEQSFTSAGKQWRRLGLLARVRLEPWDAGVVLPHERTLSKPKDDRLKVMRATAANLSPIMAVYDDLKGELVANFQTRRAAPPALAFTDEAGEEHCLWPIADAAFAQTVSDFFRERQLYIADGHHRYETALTYRDELLELRKELAPDASANFVLMSLSAIEDPGLVVLPTHRVIRGLDAALPLDLAALLGDHFALEPLTGDDPAEWLATLDHASGADGLPAFVLVTKEGAHLARLTPAGHAAMPTRSAEGTNLSEAWQRLDVAVLQELVLKQALGLTDETIRQGEHVSYSRDADAATAAVRGQTDGAQVAALLHATPALAMRDVARAGDRMPQKSTYFYPKLITGLVINPLW